jgi:hypothetical protein
MEERLSDFGAWVKLVEYFEHHETTPAGKTRRRVAVIFGIVGMGLVLLHMNR